MGLIALPAFTCFIQPLRAQNPPYPGTTSSSSDSSQSDKPADKNKKDSAPHQPTALPPDKNPGGNYRIGVEDSLFISVWKEPDLSSQVTVRPDGIVTLPLVGDIYVVGLSTEQLQNLLTDKLKPFVNEPQVTVIVRDIKSRKVFLAGQAGHPSSYPINGRLTVMQLIVQSGGLGPFAKTESIYVLRIQDGKETRIPFKYKKVLAGKMADVELQPGDMVVVP
jgi:polysaccharide biosynthesis/export protein